MADPVLSEFRKTAQTKQILELRLERENYEKAAKFLDQSNSSGSSSDVTSKKRKSTRIHNQSSKKPRLYQCHDKLQIPGRSGTLGSNLLCLADTFDSNTNKSKYFHELCRNRIIDISDDKPGSQLAMLKLDKKSNLVDKKLKHFVNDVFDIQKITSLTKITNKKSAANCLEEAEKFVPDNDQDRIMKRLLCNILDLHAHQTFKLTDKYWRRCSEQSIIVKFWANVFETFFSCHDKVFLQWGDTLSTNHDEMNGWTMRLDLRFLVSTMDHNEDSDGEDKQVEAGTGEFASTSNTSTTKLYKDKLKSVLASKVHLNSILKSMKFMPPSTINSITVPIVQIMGTSCYIYTLSLVDKKVYCVQNMCSFCFPRTLKELKQEGFEKMISCLTKLETIVSDVMDLHQSYSQDTTNTMTKVYGDKSDKEKRCSIDEYISPLTEPAGCEGIQSSDDNDEDDEKTDDLDNHGM